jgi:hypothetical protein
MQLSLPDLTVINQSLFGLIKELENLSSFRTSVRDESLRSLFDEQWKTHLTNYDALVNLLHDHAFSQPNSSPLHRTRSQHASDVHNLSLDARLSTPTDRLMAFSHFLAVSRAGREYGGYLFEVSYPPLYDYLWNTLALYSSDAQSLKGWITANGYFLTQWAAPEQVAELQGVFFLS